MKRCRFRCRMKYYFNITFIQVQLKKIRPTGLNKGSCTVPRRTREAGCEPRHPQSSDTFLGEEKTRPSHASLEMPASPERTSPPVSRLEPERKVLPLGQEDSGSAGAVSRFQSSRTCCWKHLWDALACAGAQQARGGQV